MRKKGKIRKMFSRGYKSRGNKSRGYKSRGYKSRGYKSRGYKSRRNKSRRNKSRRNKNWGNILFEEISWSRNQLKTKPKFSPIFPPDKFTHSSRQNCIYCCL